MMSQRSLKHVSVRWRDDGRHSGSARQAFAQQFGHGYHLAERPCWNRRYLKGARHDSLFSGQIKETYALKEFRRFNPQEPGFHLRRIVRDVIDKPARERQKIPAVDQIGVA